MCVLSLVFCSHECGPYAQECVRPECLCQRIRRLLCCWNPVESQHTVCHQLTKMMEANVDMLGALTQLRTGGEGDGGTIVAIERSRLLLRSSHPTVS